MTCWFVDTHAKVSLILGNVPLSYINSHWDTYELISFKLGLMLEMTICLHFGISVNDLDFHPRSQSCKIARTCAASVFKWHGVAKSIVLQWLTM